MALLLGAPEKLCAPAEKGPGGGIIRIGLRGQGRMGRIGHEILSRLFDEHASALVLYARQRCETAEDVVQEAFVSLARQRTMPDRVVPWLYRVVRNGALMAARGARRRRSREARASGREAWFATADDRIDAQRAQALLSELEPDVREAIVARIWGGLTFEEIAQAQGCSVTTVHRRYQAGLARLHERLERPWTLLTPSPETI
jgi:RNA polymerase sigma factor (sigma-70 family)